MSYILDADFVNKSKNEVVLIKEKLKDLEMLSEIMSCGDKEDVRRFQNEISIVSGKLRKRIGIERNKISTHALEITGVQN